MTVTVPVMLFRLMSGTRPTDENVQLGQPMPLGVERPLSAGVYVEAGHAPVGIWISSRASAMILTVFERLHFASVFGLPAVRGSGGVASPVATRRVEPERRADVVRVLRVEEDVQF